MKEEYFLIDVQLFADRSDKTEKATPKKKLDARRKGQVFQSREISSAFVLLFLFVGLRIFGNDMFARLLSYMKEIFTKYSHTGNLYTFDMLTAFFYEVVVTILLIVGPLLGISLFIGVVASYSQVGFLFTVETLKFKFSRINPGSGIKRIFSMRGLTEMFKAVFKISVCGVVAYTYLNNELSNIVNTMNMEVLSLFAYTFDIIFGVAIRICLAIFLLAILDYGYQWWDYEKNLKMSKQEIKEEYKQTEGNPEIKSRIKQKQRQMSMMRMMQEVPKADVVITNPTHFAVALLYDTEKSDAPFVVAKGQDYIALRIKEIARANKVQVVEDKKLARTLFEKTEVGDKIPQELFQAVAEVLAYVYSINSRNKQKLTANRENRPENKSLHKKRSKHKSSGTQGESNRRYA